MGCGWAVVAEVWGGPEQICDSPGSATSCSRCCERAPARLTLDSMRQRPKNRNNP